MIEIKHKLTGDVICTVEADTLREADLRWADLRGADCLYAFAPQLLIIVGSRDVIITAEPERVHIGCICHTLAEWIERYEEIGGADGYDAAAIAEYKAHLDYVTAWFAAREGGAA